MTDQQPPRISRQSKIVLGVIAAAGLAIALWLTLAPNRIVGPTGDPTTAPAPATNDPREAVRGDIPEGLGLSPDGVAPGTRAIAAVLPPDPAEAAKAIAQARKDGLLPARPVPGDALGAPRMAGELGDAFTKKQTMQASSFELATLLGSVLKSRGGAVEYGAVSKTRFDATELLARRFVVRLKGGPWLSPDGGPSEGAVMLSDLDRLGYVLAYRALGAIAKKDGDNASRAAGLARRLLPDDPAVAFAVGDAQVLNALPDDARRTYEKAAAINADAMTWFRLGQRARVELRPFKADEYFKKAVAADPTFAAPHVGLAELVLERLDVTPTDEHPKLLDAARQSVADAEKADASAAGIRIIKAHLLSVDGKNDEARALLEDEVKLHPEEVMSFVMLANVYATEHKDAEALKTLEDARAAGHETADVLEGLGTLYSVMSRFDDAKKAFERALELNPDDATYRLQLAQLERQGGNIEKTRALLEAQITKFPDDPMGGLLLAQLELANEQPGKAKLQVNKVLAKNPTNKEAIVLDYFIGVVSEKPSPEARAKAVQMIGTRRKLAELLLQNGLTGEAETVLKDALTTEAEDMVVPVLLVAIYTATNRAEDATTLRATTLAKIDPEHKAELEKLFEDAIAQALKSQQPEPINP